jgi:hypothetical protein
MFARIPTAPLSRITFTAGTGNTLGTSSVGISDIYTSYGTTNDGLGGLISVANSSGTILWSRKLDETSVSQDDSVYAINSDASGNVYVGGRYFWSSTQWLQAPTAKFNSSGTLQWQKVLASTSGQSETWGVASDSSGNVYAGHRFGASTNPNAGNRIVLIKYDSSGSTQWSRAVEPPAEDLSGGAGVAVNSSGDSIYFTGHFSYKPIVVKFNSSGTLQWGRKFTDGSGGSDNMFPSFTKLDSSENVYTGFYNFSSASSTLAKYNSSGTIQWQRKISGNYFNDVTIDSSGNVYTIISGGSGSYILKFNSSGSLQWQRKYVWDSGSSMDAIRLSSDQQSINAWAYTQTTWIKTNISGGDISTYTFNNGKTLTISASSDIVVSNGTGTDAAMSSSVSSISPSIGNGTQTISTITAVTSTTETV